MRPAVPSEMPPRTLASFAHALTVAASQDAALAALADALVEIDRTAKLAFVSFDLRHDMLRERRMVTDEPQSIASVVALDTTYEHLPAKQRAAIAAGGQLVDMGDAAEEVARLLQIPPLGEPGWLSVRGVLADGRLSALLVLYEARKLFGTRTAERFSPAVALFELAYLRLLDRDARDEAVATLEDVTHRVHEGYDRRLAELEERLSTAQQPFIGEPAAVVALERALSAAREDARRANRRADAVDEAIAAAVEQLEKTHIELHRRSESLRQKTRTMYLLERVLTLDASTDDPHKLVDGLLALVGDDMQAHRCSLMLRTADGAGLYLAAVRGVAPGIIEGTRVPLGQGVAGRVAMSREPVLMSDVAETKSHPLLHDQFFTTGSFISFPLVYRDELVGVVNLANRAQHGVFVEEDVDRVRLLGLVIALVASQARLPQRLDEAARAR
ncbi:MAG: GAF domain-containing protein [Gemmatimonadaceae bacterium]